MIGEVVILRDFIALADLSHSVMIYVMYFILLLLLILLRPYLAPILRSMRAKRRYFRKNLLSRSKTLVLPFRRALLFRMLVACWAQPCRFPLSYVCLLN